MIKNDHIDSSSKYGSSILTEPLSLSTALVSQSLSMSSSFSFLLPQTACPGQICGDEFFILFGCRRYSCKLSFDTDMQLNSSLLSSKWSLKAKMRDGKLLVYFSLPAQLLVQDHAAEYPDSIWHVRIRAGVHACTCNSREADHYLGCLWRRQYSGEDGRMLNSDLRHGWSSHCWQLPMHIQNCLRVNRPLLQIRNTFIGCKAQSWDSSLKVSTGGFLRQGITSTFLLSKIFV